MTASVIVLPVVRIERDPMNGVTVEFFDGPGASIMDINAFRYARERLCAERRERTSLLPSDCGGG